MAETFFILFAGGILLAIAVPDPKAVTLHWLRLGGIIGLCFCGLAGFFYLRRDVIADTPAFFRRIQAGLMLATPLAVLGQLAFVQMSMRRTQRIFAVAAFVIAVLAGSNLLHDLMLIRGTALAFRPKPLAVALQTLSSAGVAGMTGLVLMDMLLGHAYLTAAKMTVAPFWRLNLALAVALVLRTIMAVGLVLFLQSREPVPMFWGVHGVYVLTRWLVGLLLPAIFIYMAHDCIRRRSTQSATGILYVAGVLVLLGEMVALFLVRETGLPF